MHGWPLYLTTSITGNLPLLTQFMSFQGPCLLFKISWILRSKNCYFVFLAVLWNCFQSSKLFEDLYFFKSLLQLLSHQLLECLVMLMVFALFSQAILTTFVKLLMVWSRLVISDIKEVLMLLNDDMRSLMNVTFSSLSLTIDHLLVLMCSSIMGMVIVRGTWLENNL